MRDLGALPVDVDIDAVIRDLGLDRPPIDPTTLTAEELTAEIRNLTKGLLGYGARMPKELMLYVKDMLFLDGALAVMAPNVDVIGEIVRVVLYFHERHGDRIAKEMGVEPGHHPRPRRGRHPGLSSAWAKPWTPSPTASSRSAASSSGAASSTTNAGRAPAALTASLEPAEPRSGPARRAQTGGLCEPKCVEVVPSSRSDPLFRCPGALRGPSGCHVPPLACNTVWSVTRLAVDVPPETTAVTCTVSPVLTLPMPISPPLTLVPESTVKVPDVPSALFTVSDHVLPDVSVTAETVPVRSDSCLVPVRALDRELAVDDRRRRDPGPPNGHRRRTRPGRGRGRRTRAADRAPSWWWSRLEAVAGRRRGVGAPGAWRPGPVRWRPRPRRPQHRRPPPASASAGEGGRGGRGGAPPGA